MSFLVLIPLFLFLLVCLGLAFYVRKHSPHKDFNREFFVGERRLGPFVLAMTTIATYGSVTVFVGFPGQAWDYGFGWVYISAVQVVALIVLYGVMGKKLALISRRTHSVSIVDIIRERYHSSLLTALCAIIIVVFFVGLTIVQFVGAAKIFEAVTGYSYLTGLLIVGIAAAVYTTVGGYRGVAITDALCGICMIIGAVILGAGILNAGGGYETIMQSIAANKPDMFDVFAGGHMNVSLFISQWLIIGVLVFAMPHTAVRCLSFDTTNSLRHALIIGTVVMGALLIGLTALGALSYGVFPNALNEYGANVDDVIPLAMSQTLPSILMAIVIIGPVAAAISTVSSLLISSCASIIRGVYAQRAPQQKRKDYERKVRNGSEIATIVLAGIALLLSMTPPDLIWRISMFAFGGIEAAFTWMIFLGLYWSRANKTGALLSVIVGSVSYFIATPLDLNVFGEYNEILISLTASLIAMIFGSLISKEQQNSKVMAIFFPHHIPLEQYARAENMPLEMARELSIPETTSQGQQRTRSGHHPLLKRRNDKK